jgi:hypothetical protein
MARYFTVRQASWGWLVWGSLASSEEIRDGLADSPAHMDKCQGKPPLPLSRSLPRISRKSTRTPSSSSGAACSEWEYRSGRSTMQRTTSSWWCTADCPDASQGATLCWTYGMVCTYAYELDCPDGCSGGDLQQEACVDGQWVNILHTAGAPECFCP